MPNASRLVVPQCRDSVIEIAKQMNDRH